MARSILLIAILAAAARAQGSGYSFVTLAGLPLLGHADGSVATAGFASPNGVAVDKDGNVYVADSYNHTIRKISPAGVVSTLAGLAGNPGSADGVGTAARFRYPHGVTVDPAGNVYVADEQNNTIRKITPAGAVSTLAGLSGTNGSADGTGSGARFNLPLAVAADRLGNVYVADALNATVRAITPAGVVTTLAGQAGSVGSADGVGGAARFVEPAGVAVDAVGNVYVGDIGNDTIRKITPAGVVTTFAGQASLAGSADGVGSAARFRFPSGLAVDATGNVYVADNSNETIRKISPAGAVSTLAGLASQWGSADGAGGAARFGSPNCVAVDAAGIVYVADTDNSLIRTISPAGVVATLAGRIGSEGSADGTGSAARFFYPEGITVDLTGNIYMSDSNNTIRQITPAGVVTTFAGAPGQSGSADGPGAAARFLSPAGLAMDAAGNLYVADEENYTIRKITPAGVVSTFAGQAGNPGAVDGIASAARFSQPSGLAFDGAGNLYVTDRGNATIRKISPAGVVSTLAGQAGVAGYLDGTGSVARFLEPGPLALDRAGNLYVSDAAATVRKITPDGVVTTLAGKPGLHGSTDGAGSDARFAGIFGLAVDRNGYIYATDSNNLIRRVSPAGSVTTLAGQAGAYGSEDGNGDATRFFFPSGVALDLAGNLYVTDSGNNTLRKAVSTTRLVNLSIRSRVGTGDQALLMGFGLAGTGAEPVLVRGVGPTLGSMGVLGGVADPQLKLFGAAGAQIDANDNWGGSTQLSQIFAAVGAFPLDPTSKDAALYSALPPQTYSAQVAASDATGGVALLELYDADAGTAGRLINASARTTAGSASNTLIAGFVLSGTAPKTLLIRGVGPSLVRFGVAASSVLADPKLTLYLGSTSLATNDDWGGAGELKAAFKSVGAFDLDSDTSKDAAFLVTLDPGAYTVVTTGAGSTTGVALVEIYEVP